MQLADILLCYYHTVWPLLGLFIYEAKTTVHLKLKHRLGFIWHEGKIGKNKTKTRKVTLVEIVILCSLTLPKKKKKNLIGGSHSWCQKAGRRRLAFNYR